MTQTHRGRAYGGVLYEENGYLYYRTDTGLVYALGIGAVAEVLGQVILFAAAGTTTFYDADDAGLTAALAAAVPDDIVAVLGSVTFSAAHAVPDGVSLTSPTGGVVMTGAVTFGNDSGLIGISIQLSGTGNLTSLTGPVSGTVGFARDCHLSVNSTDGGTALAASGLVYLYGCVLRAVSNGAAVVPVDATVQLMACDYSVPGGVTLYGDRADWIRLGKILLYKASGAQMMVYEATSAGLAAALAAAVSGDVVALPACAITGGPWTVASGVTVRGLGRGSILTGDLTNNGTTDNVRVYGVFSNTYGYARNIYVVGRVVNNGSSQLEYSEVSATSGRGVDMDSGWCRHVNVTLDGANYGFYMTGGHLFYCRVNVNSGSTGVFCDASNSVISFCRFAGMTYGGIIRNCTIVGNSQFEAVSGDGLLHDSGSTYIIASNFYTNGGGYGLNASASGITIDDCSWTNISGEANISYGEGDRVGGNGTEDVLLRWKAGGNNVQDSHLKDAVTGNYLASLAAALTGNHTYTLQDADMTLAALNLGNGTTPQQVFTRGQYISAPGEAALTMERTTDATNAIETVMAFRLKTSGEMADGFGPRYTFQFEDATSGGAITAAEIVTTRRGADNTSWLQMIIRDAGTGRYRINLHPTGVLLGSGLSSTTAPSAPVHAFLSDATTDTAETVAAIEHTTSGTPAAGFGARLAAYLESSTTARQLAGAIDWLWTTATHATRTADIVFSAVLSGTLGEVWRMTAAGRLDGKKAGITEEGGYYCVLTAGESLSRGEVVQITQGAGGADGKVYKNAIDGDMPIGVVYADASADAAVKIITSGIAYVLPESGYTATRGYVIYSSDATAGRVDQANTVPAALQHFREIGHWLDTGSGNGVLTRAIIHFN